MIGIYKITSPNKRIYIGQSINIETRFNQYKRLACEGQTILYRSLVKYGVENHFFEVICECSIEELNDKERYYQDLYSIIGEKGMNCMLTNTKDKKGFMSEESKIKISLANTGKKRSEETKLKISLVQKGKKHSEDTKNKMREAHKDYKMSDEQLEKFKKINIGRIRTTEQRLNSSLARKGYGKGRKLSQEHKEKIGLSNKGKGFGINLSIEHKLKISKSVTGKKKGYIMPENVKAKISKSHNPKKIININTGVIYNSVREASFLIPMNINTLKTCIRKCKKFKYYI